MAPDGITVRFTKTHEDSGVLYQPGQEATVSAASADYIASVAKSGHRVTPLTAPEPTQRAGRAKEE